MSNFYTCVCESTTICKKQTPLPECLVDFVVSGEDGAITVGGSLESFVVETWKQIAQYNHPHNKEVRIPV